MTGCTNPAATNFDPSATEDDGSCQYITQIGDVCYLFEDFDPTKVVDHSATISFAIESNNWVFYHDYIPDYYFHTRKKLHLVKNSKVYTAGEGAPGSYLGNSVRPFFIDVVLRFDDEQTLNALNWVSEILDSTAQDVEFKTFTHITIWNSYQSTGKIALDQVFDGMEVNNIRRTKSEWYFNDFRDIVKTRGTKFIEDIFSDFAMKTSELDDDQPWYDKRLMEDNYFIVRLEYDNTTGNTVFLHDINPLTTQSNL